MADLDSLAKLPQPQAVRADKARNEAREAATALRKQAGTPVWLQRPGGVLVKVPRHLAMELLQKGGVAREPDTAEHDTSLTSPLAALSCRPARA